jgi:hypothetical protein
MRYRKLRITWTVFCGIACVLLIVLWVRSYWWVDTMDYESAITTVSIDPSWGTTSIMLNSSSYRTLRTGWHFERNAIGSFEKPDVTLFGFCWIWQSEDGIFVAGVPHWLSASAVGAFCYLPWMHWRFSRRALLIGTTLIAVLLALEIGAAKKYNRIMELEKEYARKMQLY